MAAVFADEATVTAEIEQCDRADLAIAALNGPANTVVSGERDAVAALFARFEALGIRCRLLSVSHAFHSPLMRPAVDAFVPIATSAQGLPPAIPWISTVSAKPMQGPPDASYWRDHALSAVRFAEGVQVLGQAGMSDAVEIGPGSTLLTLARQNGSADGKTWLGSLSRRGEANEILTSLGTLYRRGFDIDWEGFNRHSPSRRMSLPTYPFERRRFWIEAAAYPQQTTTSSKGLTCLRRRSTREEPDQLTRPGSPFRRRPGWEVGGGSHRVTTSL
jgi:acyl transferase domain-containing protein